MTFAFIRVLFTLLSTVVGFQLGSAYQGVGNSWGLIGAGIGAGGALFIILVERTIGKISMRGLSAAVFGLILAFIVSRFLTSAIDLIPELGAMASSTLKRLLKSCVDRTFNVISVDGDTSTNDMVLILANGRAGNISFKKNSPLYRQFEKKLLEVCHELALMMVRDGEGATKVVRLEVKGARNHTEAQKIVRTVGNSLLVKTAFFGGDPNWGRLVAAAGRAGVPFHPHKLDLFYDQVLLVQKGVLKNSMAERRAKKIAKKNSFGVRVVQMKRQIMQNLLLIFLVPEPGLIHKFGLFRVSQHDQSTVIIKALMQQLYNRREQCIEFILSCQGLTDFINEHRTLIIDINLLKEFV